MPKHTAALVKEARALQRRASKLAAAAGREDLATARLLAEAETAIQRAVDHLASLERTQQRRIRDAIRRGR